MNTAPKFAMTVTELIDKLREVEADNPHHPVYFEPRQNDDARVPIRSVYVSAIYDDPPRYVEGEIVKDPQCYIIAVSDDPE